jgi:branched-chain amino acid transport system substrate-binding protein
LTHTREFAYGRDDRPPATAPEVPVVHDASRSGSASRRQFLTGTGAGLAGLLGGGPLLAGCDSSSGSGGRPGRTIKIGFVSPRTGASAGVGEPDSYVLDLARKALATGLKIGGTRYDVEVIDRDSQTNPVASAQVANDLIHGVGVDLMLATSTPETVNPVSDVCEISGVPCISTIVPWEAWYFGRGATPDKPFTYTYHFCFGVEEFAKSYASMWRQVASNKKVGVMWPNDPDGTAIRKSLGPALRKAGYTIVDPGPYTDGTNDYGAQITLFREQDCQIFNTFPLPPDFATFWTQAVQQGYKPKIAQIAKTVLVLSQIEALGENGFGLAAGTYWHPTFPYTSPLTGVSSRQLGDGYQARTGKQWNQQLGASLALFDVAAAALRASGDPRDKAGVAKAMATLGVETSLGPLTWGKGPVPNVVTTPVMGAQWVKSAPTSRYPVELVVCDNITDLRVPIGGQLQPYA